MTRPVIEQASQRATEIERLILLSEAEQRRSDPRFAHRWTRIELGTIAGALRYTSKHLCDAIRRMIEGGIVCAACHRETPEVQRSQSLEGARCAWCAVPALDRKIAELEAEIRRLRGLLPIYDATDRARRLGR